MAASKHIFTKQVPQQRQSSLSSSPQHAHADLQTWPASHHEQMKRCCVQKIAYHEHMAQFHKEQLMYYSHKPRGSATETATAMPSIAHAPEAVCDIGDAQWERIAPLLTLGSGLGRPYADTRRTLNGILYVLKTHCGWRNMPKHYGSYVTCWRRLTRWQAKGIWQQIEQILALSTTATLSEA